MMTVQQAFDLALQHHQAGRLPEAEALYRQILAVQPNHADSLHFLGVIAYQKGDYSLAAERIHQAILLAPNNAIAHSNFGLACQASGRLEEAVAAFRRALSLKPDYAEGLSNLGSVLWQLGSLEEAARLCHRASELNPDLPGAHLNLGNVLREQCRFDEAVCAYRNALRIKPDYAEAHNNLGAVQAEQGQFVEAIASYRQALLLGSGYTQAHNNLGNALWSLGCVDDAISEYRQALAIKPDYPEALNNLANALSDRGQLEEAISACRRAIAIAPEYIAPYNTLGNALKDQAELGDALGVYRQGVKLKPDDAGLHSNLIYTLYFDADSDERVIAEERDRWNVRFSQSSKRLKSGHVKDGNPDRRLRIGYISADFRDHVIGRNLLPLFRNQDRRNFEFVCYSGIARSDAITEEYRRRATKWQNTRGLGDDEFATMIRQDAIDILVDLAQHMAGNRLPVFARRPAPVQVSFAGYPESTGLETINYRITDKWLEKDVAPSTENLLVKSSGHERVYLIDSFWCYDPCGLEVHINGLPAQDAKVITFGSLNNFCKVNEPLLKLWARVLKSVKEAHLIILSYEGSHRQQTLQFLENEGVASHRVEFAIPRPRKEYMELHHRLDIVLDTFPYNGHTTSLDALWMGVPVVSLCGERPVSRAGLSQLNNLGLPELVAHSENEYVEIAVKLAGDLPRLAELRATLRKRMEASVLMDAPRFARQIEDAYRAMWRQWCAENPAP